MTAPEKAPKMTTNAMAPLTEDARSQRVRTNMEEMMVTMRWMFRAPRLKVIKGVSE